MSGWCARWPALAKSGEPQETTHQGTGNPILEGTECPERVRALLPALDLEHAMPGWEDCSKVIGLEL